MIAKRDRIEGGLLGLLVGDALGVPYEFHAPAEIPAIDAIEMQPPLGFRRTYPDVAPGTWSDDGAQALCLLASLLHCRQFNPDDFARRLQNWRFNGYMAVDGQVFDVGNTTHESIMRLEAGVPPLRAGARNTSSNGNGSLMRVLPLALWHRGTDSELVRDAMLQSVVTHAHLRSQVCCALYCLWARGLLEGRQSPWNAAISTLRAEFASRPGPAEEICDHILPAEKTLVRGTGYVVDCLWSAKFCSDSPDFETAVRSAIVLGNDTDTTACVTGGIAGIIFGRQGIPPRWLANLREIETVEPLLAVLSC